MSTNRIVVIGASAGGIEALRQLVGGLRGFPSIHLRGHAHRAAVARGAAADSRKASALPASNARTAGAPARRAYLRRSADCHLLVEPGTLRVTKGPRENRFRPAVDPLFRSAAQVFGPGAIGVILTGNLDDGTAGLWAIKQLGGVAIVQDPRDAMFPSMPTNAIDHVHVDHVVPLADIPPLLSNLTAAPLQERIGLRFRRNWRSK